MNDDERGSWPTDPSLGRFTTREADSLLPSVPALLRAVPETPDRTVAGVDVDSSGGVVAAVDALATVAQEPVTTHAARYSSVHTLLQDALSDTDRPGA